MQFIFRTNATEAEMAKLERAKTKEEKWFYQDEDCKVGESRDIPLMFHLVKLDIACFDLHNQIS